MVNQHKVLFMEAIQVPWTLIHCVVIAISLVVDPKTRLCHGNIAAKQTAISGYYPTYQWVHYQWGTCFFHESTSDLF